MRVADRGTWVLVPCGLGDVTRRRIVQILLLLGMVLWAHAAKAAPVEDSIAQRVKACVACHGAQGKAASDGYYPRIAGKPEGYLYHELLNFRDGRRHYPAMVYMVAQMPDTYLHEIAHYFASQHPPYGPPDHPDASPTILARGQQLVRSGDAVLKVPACIACHGQALTGVLPSTPGLVGLPHDYLFAQLANWRNGSRRALQPDCMADIAGRLSQADLRAVAAWLSTQQPPADALPVPSLPTMAPLRCGSFAQ